eukprot:TRINITY_DN38307_c0_g1_i2.p1 TRINITY_DN38307_c0_g1~~TRINITY_DN38307_c0_g1_i2.p1  ORF type:complete len:437 (+),score=92.67 TRINITY_DN38307_c0_g1_i2:132-1442(+)
MPTSLGRVLSLRCVMVFSVIASVALWTTVLVLRLSPRPEKRHREPRTADAAASNHKKVMANRLALLAKRPRPDAEVLAGRQQGQRPNIADVTRAFRQGTRWADEFAERAEREATSLVQRIIASLPKDNFIGETLLTNIVVSVAESASSLPSLLVYAAAGDLGQLSFMLGTALPAASVVTLHPSAAECGGHSRSLGALRYFDISSRQSNIVAAGTWQHDEGGGGHDRLKAMLEDTPVALDVQVIVGLRQEDLLLQSAVLQSLLRLSRWTLLSFPLGSQNRRQEEEVGGQLRAALKGAAKNASAGHAAGALDAAVFPLGVVRVPATDEFQALLLVRTQSVERRTRESFHAAEKDLVMMEQQHGQNDHQRQPYSSARHAKISWRPGRNASMSVETKDDGSLVAKETREAAGGLQLETLTALGMPQSERLYSRVVVCNCT